MPGPAPQAGLDEAPAVRRIGVEAALLSVCNDFHPETEQPYAARRGCATGSRATRHVVVMAASAAPTVNVTHRPWMVQTLRKRMKDGLISSKRASFPARRTRRKRNVPRRTAQMTTIAHSRIARASTAWASRIPTRDDGDVGEAARQVKELLGLQQKGGDEGQPLDQKCQAHQRGKQRQARRGRSLAGCRRDRTSPPIRIRMGNAISALRSVVFMELRPSRGRSFRE